MQLLTGIILLLITALCTIAMHIGTHRSTRPPRQRQA